MLGDLPLVSRSDLGCEATGVSLAILEDEASSIDFVLLDTVVVATAGV